MAEGETICVSLEKLIQLAGEAGGRVAIEAYKREQQAAQKEANDRRLHNTELLLRHYRAFRGAAENAVYRAEDCDESLEQILLDLMMPGRSDSENIQSIKRSAVRTAILVQHIERMLAVYQRDCFTNGKPEDQRRWRVIDGLYIQDKRKSVAELARQEFVSERQIYDDRSTAISKIAVYMFGIDYVAHL